MRSILDALRATAAVAEGVEPVRSDDEFGLDLAFRERVTPIFRLLHDHYWRVEVSGAKHVPAEGPVIIVSNHSGALPFDGAMICTTLDTHRGLVVRYLYDRFVQGVSAVDGFYRRTGGAVVMNGSTLSVGPVEKIIARSSTLRSSRAFPGQSYASSLRTLSSSSCGAGLANDSAACSRKRRASVPMSRRTSRSAGRRTRATFSL